MSTPSQDKFQKLLLEKANTFTKQEQKLIQSMLERKHVATNINTAFDEQLTLGQRVADKVAAFGGSWTFIILFLSTIAGWIILNSVLLASRQKPFDPYPYILLNLFLSLLAAIQAPVIMMSQNRQAAKDRLDAAHDYEINIKAELEIESLHEKIDNLREKQLSSLIVAQQEEICLLTELLEKERIK